MKPFPAIKRTETLRAGKATFIGTEFRGRLQGEPALVIVDQMAPWLVLAQFDNMERLKYFSNGWHPLPASSFGPIEYDHDWQEPEAYVAQEECHCPTEEDRLKNVVDGYCYGDLANPRPNPGATCKHCGVKESTYNEHGTPCV